MLKVRIRPIPRRLPKGEGVKPDGHGTGPTGRINKMRKVVTGLLRHERLEGKQDYMDEARGYAERVIQEAAKHGDRHKPTMEMLDYWILEKDLIHKLFKVIVPRFSGSSTAATSLYCLPTEYPGRGISMAVLELKGNPWPPVLPHATDNSGTLINVLLDAAKREYREEKYRAMVGGVGGGGDSYPVEDDATSHAIESSSEVTEDNPRSKSDGKVMASSELPHVPQSSTLSGIQDAQNHHTLMSSSSDQNNSPSTTEIVEPGIIKETERSIKSPEDYEFESQAVIRGERYTLEDTDSYRSQLNRQGRQRLSGGGAAVLRGERTRADQLPEQTPEEAVRLRNLGLQSIDDFGLEKA